ncbi:pentatricopeptide repeat-containing protein At2g13600-like isoform X2 [Aristolochia californica]|uniref:pentatricopeptide repeat-containing protein At2g13600-like isoform X2 n=1 Tax=Aristolochia californica TaxID=171875 RepID=UPI0035DA8C4A
MSWIACRSEKGSPDSCIYFLISLKLPLMSLTSIQASLLHCIRIKSYRKTQQIHAHIVLNFLSSDIYLANLIIESYFKCGQPQLAYFTFDQMPERDSVSWGQIISSFSKSKQPDRAIEYFQMMGQQGCNPNRSSLLSALNACSNLSKLIEGKQLHSQTVKRISPLDVIVGNILIDFYSKCGELSESRKAFDEIPVKDLVSWTSMLSGYCQSGLATEAWGIFTFMMKQGMGFSYHAFSVTAKACAEVEDVKPGEGLHSLVIKTGFESHVFVASALLDMYSKHGKISSGRHIFDSMDEPNVVSWTSIITGYAQIDEGEEALKLFRQQIQLGILPDAFSISSMLAACANIPALDYGKQLHSLIVKLGFEFQTFAGYAQHGRGTDALGIFYQMREAKVRPNSITLVAVLSACSRSGLVEDGIGFFQSMGQVYDIEAQEEHYTCMVDLLARAGRVKEAEEFMKGMPFEPSASAWGALLSGCRACGDLNLASKCAEELFRLEPSSASNTVTLANMYAAQGKWEQMGRVRVLMKDKSLKKESGYSWIEIRGELSVFGVSDHLHPQSNVIYEILHLLLLDMRRKKN